MRDSRDDYDPSFPTFDDQISEERKKVYGHLGYSLVGNQRVPVVFEWGEAGNLAKRSIAPSGTER